MKMMRSIVMGAISVLVGAQLGWAKGKKEELFPQKNAEKKVLKGGQIEEHVERKKEQEVGEKEEQTITIKISNKCGKWLVIKNSIFEEFYTKKDSEVVKVSPDAEIYSGPSKGRAEQLVFKIRDYSAQIQMGKEIIFDVCG